MRRSAPLQRTGKNGGLNKAFYNEPDKLSRRDVGDKTKMLVEAAGM